MRRVEFFYDLTSPYTWMAFEAIEPLCARLDARLAWKPFLVGGAFNTVNPSVAARRANPVPAKAAWADKDRQDWARYRGVEGLRRGMPPGHPVNAVKVMRGCFVAIEEGVTSAYNRAVFEAYWRDFKDVADDTVVADAVESAGLDPADFFVKIASRPYKDKLRATTDELIARGGFGTPTFFVNGDDMYWGNDRLLLVEEALARAEPD